MTLQQIADWMENLKIDPADVMEVRERVSERVNAFIRQQGREHIARALRLDIVPRSLKGYNLSYVGRITLVSVFMKKTLDVTWPGK